MEHDKCAECGGSSVKGATGIIVYVYESELRAGEPTEKVFLCSVGSPGTCGARYMQRTSALGMRRLVRYAIPASEA
jgi:hypothetical protein